MISIQRRPDPNRDRWMISYMDVLTILLIFFIAAAAQTALPKSMPVVVPVAPATLPPPRDPLVALQEKLAPLGLDLKIESRGLVISLPQTILFASGDDAISAQAKPTMEEISNVLRGIPNKVSLVGHADDIPIHNRRFKNNWELASARSLRLLELLGRDGSIDESRLSVSSFGSFDPKKTNDTEIGRAGNRRVEIVILAERYAPAAL